MSNLLDDCPSASSSSSKLMSAKYGKKPYGSDESRRDTYYLSCESDSGQDQIMTPFGGLDRQLIAVCVSLKSY